MKVASLQAWQLSVSFVGELVRLAQRSQAGAEWDRKHAAAEIDVFTKALELPPRERFRAEQLLQLGYDLAIQGHQHWFLAAEHAVPTDTSVRIVLSASPPSSRGKGRVAKASRTAGKRGRS